MKRSITIMYRHGTCRTDISSSSPGRVCTPAIFSYAVLGPIHHSFAMAGGPLQMDHSDASLHHSHGSHGALRYGYWMTSRSARRGSRYLKFASSTRAP